jgi:hypothetical protein
MADTAVWFRNGPVAQHKGGLSVSEKDGILQLQPSGRWAVVCPGREPVEITAGDVFRVEVPGKGGLHLTRMEHLPGEGYYSVKGYSLYDGLRAAIGDRD